MPMQHFTRDKNGAIISAVMISQSLYVVFRTCLKTACTSSFTIWNSWALVDHQLKAKEGFICPRTKNNFDYALPKVFCLFGK